MLAGGTRMLSKVQKSLLPPIKYNGVVIPWSESIKNLGLYIDSSLSWRTHVTEISKKVNGTLHALYRLKNFLPFKTKVMLVQALVIPHLDYADVCCTDLSEELLNKLERLLNNCIRYIFGLRKYDHISQFRSQLKWLPIRHRRNSRILSTLYTILNNVSSPDYLKENFQFVCSIHDRGLRSSKNLKISLPSHSTGYFGNSFTVQSILLWNSLPVDIKKSPTICSFKSRVRLHYLKQIE